MARLEDIRLSAAARNLIVDPNNAVYLSPASYREIGIKIRTGKYALPGPFEAFMSRQIQQNGFVGLPIRLSHAAIVTTLPLYHRDPFDRMLIAQSLVGKLSILSMDRLFDQYGVTRLW